jgi:zinc protease
VTAITREDVRAHYQRWYQPGALTLIVAGDVGADEATALVSRSFADWRGETPPRASTTDAPARTSRGLHIVAKADAPQSELRVGNVGLPRAHDDYYAAVVMNAILGGLFSSRINLNLREEHGYTYGAFSSFDWRRGSGPFVVSTAVQSDVTAAAATEVMREIERIRSDEVSDTELSLATSYLDGVFPIRYETTDAIAGALATLVRFGLPDDYFDSYRARMRAVTTADVLRVARAHLRPDALQMLVVGDPAVVRAPLEALKFGPTTMLEP